MSRPVSRTPQLLAFALLLCGVVCDAFAQFASNIRLTNPIGRTVLEIRQGTQPANPRLLFTAVITAGPTGGTTSLLLQQAFLRDIFNPAVAAAGWTTVRSSITAFSLGGGCGRNNLIDFPFINNSRPEILRITGTTHQVTTLGIAGNDQYDSIDCIVQGDGRVLYMLTNRTRQRLELRREQGGLMVLVRDDFGTVITPFIGGMRPSIGRLPRGIAPIAPDRGYNVANVAIFFKVLTDPEFATIHVRGLHDTPVLSDLSTCPLGITPRPTGFTEPEESAVSGNVAVGHSRDNKSLWADYFDAGPGGCTQLEAPESLGSAGPFSLFTWGGVAANSVGGNEGGATIEHTTFITPSIVRIREGNQSHTLASPFSGRGGPGDLCPLSGTEIDTAQVAAGVGPSALQVQHSIISGNLVESHARTGFEDPADSTPNCD